LGLTLQLLPSIDLSSAALVVWLLRQRQEKDKRAS